MKKLSNIITTLLLAIISLPEATAQMYPQRDTEDFNCPKNTKSVIYESFELNQNIIGKRISGPFLKSNREIQFNEDGNVIQIKQYKIENDRLELSHIHNYYWNKVSAKLDSIVSTNGLIKKYNYEGDSITIETNTSERGITKSKTVFANYKSETLYENSNGIYQIRRTIQFDSIGRNSLIKYYNNGSLSQIIELFYKDDSTKEYCKSFYKVREEKYSYRYSEYDKKGNLIESTSTAENDLLRSKSLKIYTYDKYGNWITEKTKFYSVKTENSWANKVLKILKPKDYEKRKGYNRLNIRTIEYY